VLIALALAGMLFALETSSPLPGPSVWMLMVITAFGLSAMFLIALRMALPALVLNSEQLRRRLSPAGEGQ
jgi:hypothetical protein